MPKNRPHKALTAKQVQHISTPGRHADGEGLYLYVDHTGYKRWILRLIVPSRGKRCDISIGGLTQFTLAQAREEAGRMRRLAKEGGDPIAERQERRRQKPVLTFKEAAEQVHEIHKATWKNEKHAWQWLHSLKQLVFPVFGSQFVNQTQSVDVLKALQPIWLAKPETARRVKQRIKTVFDWAIAYGYRKEGNPVEGVNKALPKQTDRDKHHAALPYSDVAKVIEGLRKADAAASAKLAREFLILTAARTGEVILARPEEFDLDNRIWTTPAERKKSSREHRVPLSDRAVALIIEARKLSGGRYIFPGRVDGKPLSNMALLMLLRRMDYQEITAHGFRSTFRDWAAERTNFPHEVCEAALAHALKSKTEAAYKRTDLFEKRRELMNTWATFCSS